jgi:hypothetical protein
MLALRVMRENDWWEQFWAAEAPHVAAHISRLRG